MLRRLILLEYSANTISTQLARQRLYLCCVCGMMLFPFSVRWRALSSQQCRFVPGHFVLIYIHLTKQWRDRHKSYVIGPAVQKCWIVGFDSIQRASYISEALISKVFNIFALDLPLIQQPLMWKCTLGPSRCTELTNAALSCALA